MELQQGVILIILGVFLFSGYLAHVASSRTFIPGVTVLLLLGLLFSPTVLGIIPKEASQWFPFVSHIALAMVGFLLGESFFGEKLKKMGKKVLWISVGETLMAVGAVLVVLLIIGVSLPMALILAGIAPASAPAAIFETIKETRAKGPLTDTVLGVVAIDDAWGVIAFSICFVIAQTLSGGGSGLDQILRGSWEVGGALLLGVIMGFPMAWITGKVRDGETTLVEAMGFVFLCSGIALYLEVSYLLACMCMGAIVANFAKNRTHPFHEIEKIRAPFLAVFFILAGFKLEIHTLAGLGIIGAVYIAARTAGLVTGSYIIGKILKNSKDIASYVGWCLLPQAGVALGFALLASERMPDIGGKILNLVIATTVVFELTGPLLARWNLKRAGEI